MVDLDNFDKIQKRMTALWDREIIDRCCISVFAYDQQAMQEFYTLPDEKMDCRYFMTDPEMIRSRHMNLFDKSYYAGEAFPLVNLNMGPSGHTAFVKGVQPGYSPSTIWYDHIMEHDDELEPKKIVFDEHAYLYEQTFRAAEYLTSHADGRYMVSMPDVAGNMDALSELRTPTNLLMDLVTEEELVVACLDRIEKIWEHSTKRAYECLKDSCFGGSCIGWLNTWAPGFHNQMQVDMSVMFSNDYYERYARRELERQSGLLDYALYHLDGQEQLRHLDTMLSIDDLKMIQWTNVAGQPSRVQFIPEFKRIQKAGKCLLILCEADEVEPLLENLSSRGLLLNVKVKSKEEADAMVKLAEKLTRE
ncbi:MAG: hypothetical protein PHS82_07400 [Lachnospiraceae bacterium]|nr:hypothetical protein [Lachnospiraceae bacterium]